MKKLETNSVQIKPFKLEKFLKRTLLSKRDKKTFSNWVFYSSLKNPKLSPKFTTTLKELAVNFPTSCGYILFPSLDDINACFTDFLCRIIVAPELAQRIEATPDYKLGILDPELLRYISEDNKVLDNKSIAAMKLSNKTNLSGLLSKVTLQKNYAKITRPSHGLEECHSREKAVFDAFMSSTTLETLTDIQAEGISYWRASIGFSLKHIIWCAVDISTTGGIQKRLRCTVVMAQGREVKHKVFTALNTSGQAIPYTFSADSDEEVMLKQLRAHSPYETVIVIPNNALRRFSNVMKNEIMQFPLIYMASGQMSFMIQDSNVLSNLDYVNNFKVSANLVLSKKDLEFQQQLGLYNQQLFFNPIESKGAPLPIDSKLDRVSYVGRIDYHAKNARILIDVAEEMQKRGLGPLRVCTTTNPINSPDYEAFISEIKVRNLNKAFEFLLEETQSDELYKKTSILLLPSKKEAFGNVILEAFSYGIPVISTKFAPGPSQIIENAKSGYLVDKLDVEEICDCIEKILYGQRGYKAYAKSAFEEHKLYSFEVYLQEIEKIAAETITTYTGENKLSVFPSLKMVRHFNTTKTQLTNRINIMKTQKSKQNTRIERFQERIKLMKTNSELKTKRIDKLLNRLDVVKNNSNLKTEKIIKLQTQLEKAKSEIKNLKIKM